jgi:hypothetical protein
LEDTTSSHIKNDINMIDKDLQDGGAKRRLELGNKSDELDISPDETAHDGEHEMHTDDNSPTNKSGVIEGKERKKRSKKEGANSTSLGSAGSWRSPSGRNENISLELPRVREYCGSPSASGCVEAQ